MENKCSDMHTDSRVESSELLQSARDLIVHREQPIDGSLGTGAAWRRQRGIGPRSWMALRCPPRGELGPQQLAHALFRPSRSCVDLLRLAPAASPIKLVDILHAQLRQIRFVADNGAWAPLASGAAPPTPEGAPAPSATACATLEEAVRPLIRRRRVAASVTRWGLARVPVRRWRAALAVGERLYPRRGGGALLRDGGRAVRRRRQPPLLLARRRDALRPTWRPGTKGGEFGF